jgi:hypothetical protein
MGMKLKTIVASLIGLGLSGSVLAAQAMMDTSYQLDVMRDQVNKVDMVLNQNQPGGFDQPCGWTCRINVSGWMNTDVYLGNRPPQFWIINPNFNPQLPLNIASTLASRNPLVLPATGRVSDLLLNNANLFIDARVNSWVTAVMSMVYTSMTPAAGSTNGTYAISNSLITYQPLSTTAIDTAYATISNFKVSPLYFRVGKEYVPFGQYDPYGFVVAENPTQLMTQINAPVAQLGFIMANGLYGSLYTFAGNPKLSDGGTVHRIQNGGIDLGYQFNHSNSKFNVDAGYIANIADSNFLTSYYFNSFLEGTMTPGLPVQKMPAWDVNAEVTVGPFDANGHYVGLTRKLASPLFMSGDSSRGFRIITNPPRYTGTSSPSLWGLEAGLTFPVMAHQSRVAIGYQGTTHLATLLPKQRYYIDYMVNFAKWFDLGVAVFQDRDYSLGESTIFRNTRLSTSVLPLGSAVSIGGTGNKSTVGQLRASIKFA